MSSIFLSRASGALALVVLAAISQLDADQPNVVVLFADDAGYADFGFQESARSDMAHLTPHIDSIAAAGAKFTQAYVTAAVCSPSRAGLMTGRYQERFGHETNLPPGTQSGLPLTETFGVKRLQEIGYRTGLIGKWHLGHKPKFLPTNQGFDHYLGILYSNDMRPVQIVQNETVVEYPVVQGNLTKRYTNESIDFIRKSTKS